METVTTQKRREKFNSSAMIAKYSSKKKYATSTKEQDAGVSFAM